MKFYRTVFSLLSLLLLFGLTGCRSDADHMAEFCLNFEQAVKTDDCQEMAKNMDILLAEPQPRLRDNAICEDTTACLPCRVAVREMLKKCGQNEAVSNVMKQNMHFSTLLRNQVVQPDQKDLPF